MKRQILISLILLFSLKSFSQIISPNGNNLFYYNGAADVTFRYADRGNGGRAFVHDVGNVLAINYGGDFNGGVRVGSSILFLPNGNVGIGNAEALAPLSVGTNHGVKLAIGNSGWGSKSIIETGWNSQLGDYTDLKVAGGASNNALLRLIQNGNVGIGTTNPDAPFTVYGVSSIYPNMSPIGDMRQFSIKYTLSNPTFINNDYPIVLGTGGGNQPLILDAARIGIGTTNPGYKLDVIGTIRAREVKIDLNGADFVFENGYKLMPLIELEKFVKEQKHLPEIVPAKEMKENGTDLGNLNSKLLQKMEEMTLYMIEQNKKIEALENEVKELKKK